jgi:orotidine-5'-phosphate decarboxylase
VWNFLFELDRNTVGDLRFLEKDVRCTHHNIVLPFRHRRIIAPKRDLLFAGPLLDFNLVAKRNRRDQSLDLVKAIAAKADDPQRKIDLCGSENLHNVQFALSFRAKSRNLLPEMTNVRDKIIVALDLATKEKALELVEQLRDEISFFKIGLQLYTAEGSEIVRAVLATGAKVWLDLKLYDIPNTVARAVESASTLGVQMLTIHLSGGSEMIRAATAARANEILLLGVTVLTSATEQTLREVGITDNVEDQVLRLARLGVEAGIDGIVASPHEIKTLRREFADRIKIAVQGIRPSWAEPGDQKRFMTPREAIEAGADYIGIGRPITAHAQPHEAVRKIIQELS